MSGTKGERGGVGGIWVGGNEMGISLKWCGESGSVDACTDERCGDVPDFVHDSVLFFHGSLAGTPRGPGQACLSQRRSHVFSFLVTLNLVNRNGCDNLWITSGVKLEHIKWLIDIVMVVEVQRPTGPLIVDFLPRFQILISRRVVRDHDAWRVGNRFHHGSNRITIG